MIVFGVNERGGRLAYLRHYYHFHHTNKYQTFHRQHHQPHIIVAVKIKIQRIITE